MVEKESYKEEEEEENLREEGKGLTEEGGPVPASLPASSCQPLW